MQPDNFDVISEAILHRLPLQNVWRVNCYALIFKITKRSLNNYTQDSAFNVVTDAQLDKLGNLNEKQREAIIMAVTNRVSTIIGPPGTGKVRYFEKKNSFIFFKHDRFSPSHKNWTDSFRNMKVFSWRHLQTQLPTKLQEDYTTREFR